MLWYFNFGGKHSVRSFGILVPVIEMLAPAVARKGQEPRPVRNKWLAHFIRLSNPTSRFLDTSTGRNTNAPIDTPTGRNSRRTPKCKYCIYATILQVILPLVSRDACKGKLKFHCE